MGLLGVMDTIQEGAVTLAVNEAWLLMGACTLAALVLLMMLGPKPWPRARPCGTSAWNTSAPAWSRLPRP